MPDKLAVFRCDAGPSVGYGHFSRCLGLAEALEDNGWSCRFVMNRIGAKLSFVQQARPDAIAIDVNNSPEFLIASFPKGVDLVVIDHYDLGIEYENRLISWAKLVACFDDFPDREHSARLIINPSMADNPSPKGKCHQATYLAGPLYAPLRRPFRTQSNRVDFALRNSAKRLFVNFGAVDGKGISPVAVKVARECLKDWTIDTVIGGNSPSLGRLNVLADQDEQITVHSDCLAPWELMASATLAIGAAGIGALERCAMALPSLIVSTADNQQSSFKALCESGACQAVEFSEHSQFAKELEGVLMELGRSSENRITMARHANDYCDGMGGVRIAQTIEEISAHERSAS